MNINSKTMFFLLQLVGLLPVSLTQLPMKREVIQKCTFRTVYSILLAFFFCIIYCLRIWNILIDIATPAFYWATLKYRAEIFLAIANFFSTFLCCIVSFYLAIFRLRKKIVLLESLKEADYLLQRNFSFLKLRPLSFFHIFYVCALIIINIKIASSTFIDAAAQVTKLINTFALIEFMELVLIIKEKFQVVNKLAMDTVLQGQTKPVIWTVSLPSVENSNVPSSTSVNIPKLSEIHWTLCRLVLNMAELYGPQLVVMMVYFFTHLVFIPYYLFLLQSRGGGMMLTLLNGGWLILYIIQLYMLIWPCSLATDQAHKTLAVVSQLMSSSHNTHILNQLDTFAHQLTHRHVHISACGLFTLHTPVAVSVAGAVITYLAIIIQFQESSNIQTVK